MITYSIIIPHKNIPKLLQRCLDSIPQREDLEVIVVDDNSDPEVVDFDNFPGQDRQDTTIIFDKSGIGAGRARNIGIEHARGKWLLFADADDIFTKDLAIILTEVENKVVDELFFMVESRDSDSYVPGNETKHINNAIQIALSNSPDLSYVRFKSDVPWGKILNATFLKENSISFQEVQCANDTGFSALCDFYANNIAIIPITGYCYMTRQGSLWHSRSLKSLETRFRVDMKIYRFLVNNNREDVAVRYRDRGVGFMSQIAQYSKTNYLKNYFLYGIYTHSPRVFFIDIPAVLLGYSYGFLRKIIIYNSH